MKELSIEEKAKAYDEVLKQIKECTPDENGFITIYPQEIFPELAELEDERIRKALIEGFTVMKESKNCGKTFSNHNIPVSDIIAWLEKQGQKPIKSGEWDINEFRTWQYIVSDVLTKWNGIGQYLDGGEYRTIAKKMQEEWSKKLA